MNQVLEILGNIGFEPRQALLSLINFAIVYLVISKFLFPKIAQAVEARKKQAAEAILNTQMIESKLAEIERNSKLELEKAQKQAGDLIEKAHADAKKQEEEMAEQTQTKIAQMLEDGKKQIAIEQQAMYKQMQDETVELVIAVTKKIMGDKLNKDIDSQYIKDSINSAK